MTAAILILSSTLLVLVSLTAAAAVAARRALLAKDDELAQLRAERDASGYQALVGTVVAASVIDGGSIRGTLTQVYRDAIVLAHPQFIGTARPSGIGDEVTIARSQVPMLQRFHADANGQDG